MSKPPPPLLHTPIWDCIIHHWINVGAPYNRVLYSAKHSRRFSFHHIALHTHTLRQTDRQTVTRIYRDNTINKRHFTDFFICSTTTLQTR